MQYLLDQFHYISFSITPEFNEMSNADFLKKFYFGRWEIH